MFPKEPADRDDSYRSFIRSQPCCICGRTGDFLAAHHQPKKGHGSMSLKCSDYRCVPLCTDHHTGGGTKQQPGSFHRMSWPFWGKYGIDVERLILDFNQQYFCV